eukprot:jgi/Chlat1/3651/Chrsp238S03633
MAVCPACLCQQPEELKNIIIEDSGPGTALAAELAGIPWGASWLVALITGQWLALPSMSLEQLQTLSSSPIPIQVKVTRPLAAPSASALPHAATLDAGHEEGWRVLLEQFQQEELRFLRQFEQQLQESQRRIQLQLHSMSPFITHPAQLGNST